MTDPRPAQAHLSVSKVDARAAEHVPSIPQTESAAYKLAFQDTDFLLREDLRPVRFQLELLKPELLLNEAKIGSTFVFYGSARIPSPEMADALIAAATDDEQRAVAERLKAKSQYYEVARELARLASRCRPRRGGQASISSSARAAGRRSWKPPTAAPADEGKETIGLNIVLPARADAQPLRHAGAQLPVPLFRAAQDALPAARPRGRGVPRRLRHVRRNVRAADPDPDRQGAAAADPAVRPRILEPGGRFPGAGRRGRDLARTTSTSSTGARTPSEAWDFVQHFYERQSAPGAGADRLRRSNPAL